MKRNIARATLVIVSVTAIWAVTTVPAVADRKWCRANNSSVRQEDKNGTETLSQEGVLRV
jgi:hypothetical protein